MVLTDNRILWAKNRHNDLFTHSYLRTSFLKKEMVASS